MKTNLSSELYKYRNKLCDCNNKYTNVGCAGCEAAIDNGTNELGCAFDTVIQIMNEIDMETYHDANNTKRHKIF